MQNIILIHKTKSEFGNLNLVDSLNPTWLHWQTCLREIAFGYGSLDEVPHKLRPYCLVGAKAYRFALEVICGLHSPLLGETEVLGQFRELVSKFQLSDRELNWQPIAKKWTESLLTDAKVIRQNYLVNLGSQSYGSLVRRHLQGHNSVALFGGGQLAQEILPWLYKDDRQLSLHVRNAHKITMVVERYPKIQICKLDQEKIKHDVSAVIVAAPVSSAAINTWLNLFVNRPHKIIDLREDSEKDPVEGIECIGLAEIFQEVMDTKSKLKPIADQAFKAIHDLTEKRFHLAQQMRPFGWEDICA